jgi:HEAT repeat protein
MGSNAMKVVPAIIDLLGGDDKYVRQDALDMLAKIGPGPYNEDAIPALVDLLDSDDSAEVSKAIYVMGSMGPSAKGQIPKFISFMMPGNVFSIRQAAMEALGNMGPFAVEAIPHLLEVLDEEPDSKCIGDIRAYAAEALGDIGIYTDEIDEICEALYELRKEYYKDKHSYAGYQANEALKKLEKTQIQ